ncbi:zeta toxin family protein [Streptomyces sp. NBC_01497]|uniref:zeta toxin family protein n=1 Tax=Streptomyces sp. NBC_01497 TaxID=2903885 RepID=UPI002E3749EF|nr:zeta toxin family protein [Streptomyces sp. NBC_01497]
MEIAGSLAARTQNLFERKVAASDEAIRSEVGPRRETTSGLTSQEIKSIFEDKVAPSINFVGCGRKGPTALVLIGQVGAGKTTAQQGLMKKFDIADAAVIDCDAMLAYHPRYASRAYQADVASFDDTRAIHACGEAAEVWHDMAMDRAVRTRSNIVIPMNGSIGALGDLQESGYQVEVAYLAVDDLRSKQAVIARYIDARNSQGYGRIASPDSDDRLYKRVIYMAETGQRGLFIDGINAVNRDGHVLARMTYPFKPGKQKTIVNAIKTERIREWTTGEATHFWATQIRLEQQPMASSMRDHLLSIRQRAWHERPESVRQAGLAYASPYSGGTHSRTSSSATVPGRSHHPTNPQRRR